MRLIHLIPFLVFITCCSGSTEPQSDRLEGNSAKYSSNEQGDKPSSPKSKHLELEWSKFLGHYFRHPRIDSAKKDKSDESKVHYDIRYGDNSLIIKKCQDFGICGDKYYLTFSKMVGDTVIFQLLTKDSISIRTCSFYQNSFLVYELNELNQNWEVVRYDSDRPTN